MKIYEDLISEQFASSNELDLFSNMYASGSDLEKLSTVTVSVWYTQIPRDNYKNKNISSDIIVHADTALYASKNNGRNKVTKYGQELDK